MAQKEYNDGLKLSNGIRVSLLIANFGSDPGNATMVAQPIVQAAHADKSIVGVMGLPVSADVSAAIAILQHAQLPPGLLRSGSDALTGISHFFFRIVPPDAVQARVGAAYAVQTLHAHTVALFYDPNDISSNSLAKDFEHDFTGLGGIAREQIYTAGQPEKILFQLQNLLKAPPTCCTLQDPLPI